MAGALQKGNKWLIRGWAMYDWANSAYFLTITSAIFPIYFLNVVPEDIQLAGIQLSNSSLYAWTFSLAYLVISILIPILSSLADLTGNKKAFMAAFCYIGAAGCAALFFFDVNNIWLGVVCFAVATIGMAGSLVFYNAFLPEISAPKDQDRVSALGYTYGYIGSVILLIINLVVLEVPNLFWDVEALASSLQVAEGISFEEAEIQTLNHLKGKASRIAFLSVGIWWALFAQFAFWVLPKNPFNKSEERWSVNMAYNGILQTFKRVKGDFNLGQFLLAFFIYSMGIQTVLRMATAFGDKELELETGFLIVVILVIQLVAILGAYLFAYLSKRNGNVAALKICLLIWLCITLASFAVFEKWGFLALAFFVGLVMGGVQSLSRSTFSKMLPKTQDHASYFSFFDVAEKVAIVIGTFTFAIFDLYSGSMRTAVVSVVIFLVIGLLILFRVKSSALAAQNKNIDEATND